MFYSAIYIPGQAQFENEFDFQVVWLIPSLSLFKDLLVSILCNNLLFYLHMTIKYDGLEGSSSGEYFFYFSCKVFYFSRIFFFLDKYFLFFGKYIFFLGMFLFFAKRFSVSREEVFKSRGARGFGRLFWEYVD